RHFSISVLHLRCRGRVHDARVRLVVGGQLPQAIERPLHLVDDGGAGRVGVAREKIRVALGVVRYVDPAYAAIDAAAQCRYGVGGEPAQHVIRVRVDVAVAVSGSPYLAQGVDGVRFLLAGAGVARAQVGVLDRLQYIVGINAVAAGR